MATSRTLKIEVIGDATSAKRALKETKDASDKLVPASLQANTHMSKLGDTLAAKMPVGGDLAKSAMQRVTSSMASMGPVAGAAGAAAAVGIGLLIKAGADGMKSQLAMTAEVRKYQRVTAGSAEDSSKLAAAMRAMGVDADTGAGAMGKFAKTIGTNTDKLRDHGVEIVKNKDGSVNMAATLENVAEQFKNSHNAAERATLGAAAFGKGWVTLSPILSKGKDGIHDLYAEADRHHEIFNDKDLKQGVEFQKSMREMKASVDSVERSIGQGLIPVVTELAASLEPVIHFNDELNRSTHLIEGSVKGVIGAMVPGLGSVMAWGSHHKGAAEKAKELAVQEQATEDETRKLGDAQESAAKEAADHKKALEEQAKALDKIVDASVGATSAILGLEGATDRTEQATIDYNDALKVQGAQSGKNVLAAEDLRDKGLSLKEAYVSQAQAAVKLAQDQATANGKTLSASEAATIYKNNLLMLASTVEGPVRGQLLLLIAGIRAVPDSKNITATANVNGAIAEIDRLNRMIMVTAPGPERARYQAETRFLRQARAKGGPVSAGETYLVGEEGPELFHPDKSGHITPNNAAMGGGGSLVRGAGVVNIGPIYASGPRDGELAGDAIVAKIREYERRNGTRWRTA